MSDAKRAFTLLGGAVVVMAIAMFAFYFYKDRTRKADAHIDLNQKLEETVKEEKSEFVGVYAPQDGPMEAAGKRIAFFTVNRREEGGYLGAAKIDTIGSNDSVFLNCVDVKIEEAEFFLKCVDPNEGVVSLNGTWEKSAEGQLKVTAKVLWAKDGTALLNLPNTFLLTQP